MAEESGEKPPVVNRRGFLKLLGGLAGAAAFGGLVHEATKPNSFQQQAQQLWEEYERDPQVFLSKHPSSVIDNLRVGPNGVNLRELPSAQMGKEGVVGYLKPDEPIGTALVFPNQKPGPDGPFVVIKRDNRVVFVAEKQLISAPIIANQPANP